MLKFAVVNYDDGFNMNFISVTDLTGSQILDVVSRAKAIKAGDFDTCLSGRTFGLLFEKPSLRTKMSFQIGINKLGGYGIYLGPEEVGLGKRETTEDISTVLSSYVDGIIARVNSHASLTEMATFSAVPIINALSDVEHPCQAVADLLTISENKSISPETKLAFVGDGNNVSRSLSLMCASVGISFSIATPKKYELDLDTVNLAADMAARSGATMTYCNDPIEAVYQADIVYTDAWTSMGQEKESEQRIIDFQGFTVNEELLTNANPEVIFMHDMPVHYGEEVPKNMLSSSQSVAYKQAFNRLPAQQAILEYIYKG